MIYILISFYLEFHLNLFIFLDDVSCSIQLKHTEAGSVRAHIFWDNQEKTTP